MPVDTYSREAAAKSLSFALQQFELADEVGFDWVTMAEHHFAPLSLTPNPMVMAGAVSQRVRRAKIALLGPTIPILNPVRVAEEFAILDNLSGGRLVAGMIRGTSNEYVTYNVNPAESRERFEEAMSLIVRAWTEPQPFGWQGRYYEYRSISIWPRPLQEPHPPIFMSGSSPESGELAARMHVSLGLAFTTVPLATEAVRRYRQAAEKEGWEVGRENVLYRLSAHVAATDDEAMAPLEEAERLAGRAASYSLSNRGLDDAAARAGYYGRDEQTQRGRLHRYSLDERIQLGQLVAGSPETVVSQIRRIQEEVGVGIVECVFTPGAPVESAPERTLAAIELFGAKVLPRLAEL